eukprot:CAMPEP_0202958990 /NCGR_PEP_ID=MMETSP1396-20130829/3257_1 /ASSEMBLY_ACC=CAM_ASM_000872 /TAXON_ID= /ORGANISM="Pseudokeronopsis sp., Strain Brazil" /LENGTH=231 /DNA_ID=CAMNT_0049677333 /DNA_START=22 /DNA_END=717 /DNA_ORIENTATION=-
MLSSTSEKALHDFLLCIMDAERRIEGKRQALCQIYDFNPKSSFLRLDRDNNEFIAALEVLNFLRDNKEYSLTLQDCESFVNFYDNDKDGYLDYDEFLQIVRPCEDIPLRDSVLERRPLELSRFDFLPANQEIMMSDLFITEMMVLKRIEAEKGKMGGCSVYGILGSIDKKNEGGINIDNLREFFARQGSFPTKGDLYCVIRRMDTDGDAVVTSGELAEYMQPLSESKEPKI